MTKAEQRALETYPPQFSSGKRNAKRVQSEKVDTHAAIRKIYLQGYEQAAQDLALTWQDIKRIVKIADGLMEEYDRDVTAMDEWAESEEKYYQEVLRRWENGEET